MCGIVGLISKHGTFPYYADAMFTNLVRMDSSRGMDSTGVFGVTKDGHCDIVKGDTDGFLFTRTKNYHEFLKRMSNQYRIVIGHNRAATTGEVNAKNAHPFREKHIVLVHNGTIRNKEDLNKEVEVDSHAITHALAEHDPVAALGKIDGAYALVWWDESDGSLCLARNSQRPLFLLEYEGVWAIASEPGLPVWLAGRENRKPLKVEEVPIEKILVIKMNAISKGWFEVPYEEFKFWKMPKKQTQYEYPVAYPETRRVQPPFERASGGGNIVDLTAHSKTNTANATMKSGDKITFALEDSKYEDGAEVLIGHPVFDEEKDTNIFVRAVLPPNITQEQLLMYFDHDMWTGTVQHYRFVSGVPVAYVKDIVPIILVKDGSGNVCSREELKDAVKAGCGKCKSSITVEEAEKGIARKRKDNTWRLVCPKCLEASIDAVKASKPNISLRARTH